ncbi:MAG: oxygenase MpaB family protein [Leptospirales bacterium]|jgi:hypothetical protein
MSKWTTAYLDEMNQKMDPIADKVVASILSQGAAQEMRINQLFGKLIRTSDPIPAGLPPEVRSYFEETAALPEWADPKLIRAGEKLFGEHGEMIVLMLFCRCLPMGYACHRVARVMAATGRLQEKPAGTDRMVMLNRRIMETAQFILNVMQPGGLDANGTGVRTSQKIRLIHASIRYFLEQQGWESKTLGAPINQEYLAGVVLTFSLVTIDGLKMVGVNLSDEEQLAYLHAWNVVGHIIGVEDGLIAHTVADAEELFSTIFERQKGPSQDGTDLTKSLLDYMDSKFPLDLMNAVPPYMVEKLCGPEVAAMLNVKAGKSVALKLMLEAMRFAGEVTEKLDRDSAIFREITAFLGHALLQELVNVFNEEKQIHFYIPPSLRNDWGLPPAK